MQPFGVLWEETDSLKQRDTRLSLRRLSLRADLLEQRSHGSGVDFRCLMQGDFTLFLRDAQVAQEKGLYQQWWPVTIVYSGTMRAPFEIYARAESRRYFDKLKGMFEIQSKDDFAPLVEAFDRKQMGLPTFGHWMSPNASAMMNYQKLATVP